jgi:hypothetical protein
VYLTLPETLLIFVILVAACMFFMHDKRPALLFALSVFVLLIVSFSARSISNAGQHHFVVYSANRATVIDFFAGDELLMLACEDMMENPRSQEFTVSGKRLRHGHKAAVYELPLLSSDSLIVTKYWARKGDLLAFADHTILLIENSEAALLYSSLDDAFKTDYLLIVQNPRIDLKSLLDSVRPRKVIIDASNSAWNASHWEEACHEADIEVWNVRSQGAYVSPSAPKTQNS